MKHKQSKIGVALALALAGGLLAPETASAATVNIPAGRVVNLNWTTGNEYVLAGFCYVLAPDVLTIQPGVVVKGVAGSGTVGVLDYGNLIICSGAQISAIGTIGQPIIFTSIFDDVNNPTDMPLYGTGATPPTALTANIGRGYWGGLVILGNGVINSAIDNIGDVPTILMPNRYEVFEGLLDGPDNGAVPDVGTDGILNGVNVHRFGGGNDADNSGTLQYVSIRHGGRNLASNKEINGLSMGGVGSGTTINFVEVLAFADDGYEWWGGAVNAKYVIAAFNDDDQFDTDAGFRGKIQFALGIVHKDKRDDLSEQNGQVNERSGVAVRTPFTEYQFRNATLIGPGLGSTVTSDGNIGHNVRVYNRCRWYNSIFTHTRDGRLSVSTGGSASPLSATPFALTGVEFHGNIWGQMPAVDTGSGAIFFAAPWNNQVVDPELIGVSYIADYGLDPRPAIGSPALSGAVAAPVDPAFVATTYRGAFANSGGVDSYWAHGWTHLWERGVLDHQLTVAYNPGIDTTTVSWLGVPGVTTVLQSSTDGAVWTDVAGSIAAPVAYSTVSKVISPSSSKSLFRVRRS